MAVRTDYVQFVQARPALAVANGHFVMTVTDTFAQTAIHFAEVEIADLTF
jgi:hypothetical protein